MHVVPINCLHLHLHVSPFRPDFGPTAKDCHLWQRSLNLLPKKWHLNTRNRLWHTPVLGIMYLYSLYFIPFREAVVRILQSSANCGRRREVATHVDSLFTFNTRVFFRFGLFIDVHTIHDIFCAVFQRESDLPWQGVDRSTMRPPPWSQAFNGWQERLHIFSKFITSPSFFQYLPISCPTLTVFVCICMEIISDLDNFNVSFCVSCGIPSLRSFTNLWVAKCHQWCHQIPCSTHFCWTWRPSTRDQWKDLTTSDLSFQVLITPVCMSIDVHGSVWAVTVELSLPKEIVTSSSWCRVYNFCNVYMWIVEF